MSGWMDVSFRQRSGWISSLFLYLVFKATRAENPVSHRYVVEKGIRNIIAFLDRAAYCESTCIQNCPRFFYVKISFKAVSQDSCTRLSCSLELRPATASSLWVTRGSGSSCAAHSTQGSTLRAAFSGCHLPQWSGSPSTLCWETQVVEGLVVVLSHCFVPQHEFFYGGLMVTAFPWSKRLNPFK